MRGKLPRAVFQCLQLAGLSHAVTQVSKVPGGIAREFSQMRMFSGDSLGQIERAFPEVALNAEALQSPAEA